MARPKKLKSKIPAPARPADPNKRGRGRPKKVHTAPASQLQLDALPAPGVSAQPELAPTLSPGASAPPAPAPGAPASPSTPDPALAPAQTSASPTPRSSTSSTKPARPWWYGELPYPHHVEIVRTAAVHAPLRPGDDSLTSTGRGHKIPYAARGFWEMATKMALELRDAPTLNAERFQATFLSLLIASSKLPEARGGTVPEAVLERAKLPILRDERGQVVSYPAQALTGLSLVSTFLAGGCQTFELDAALADALMRTSPAAPDDEQADPCPHLPFPCLYIAFTDRAPRHERGMPAVLAAPGPLGGTGRSLDVRGLYVWEARFDGELLEQIGLSANPDDNAQPADSNAQGAESGAAASSSTQAAPKRKKTVWLLYAAAPPNPDASDFAADSGHWWIVDWDFTPDLEAARLAFEHAVGDEHFPALSILRPDGHGFVSLEAAREHISRTAPRSAFLDGHVQWALTCLAATLSQYISSDRAKIEIREPLEAIDLERTAASLPPGARKARMIDLAQRIRLRHIRAHRIVTPSKIIAATQLQLLDEHAHAAAAPASADASPARRHRRGHWVRGHMRHVWIGARGSEERKAVIRFVFPFYRAGTAPDPEGAIDRNKLTATVRHDLLSKTTPPKP